MNLALFDPSIGCAGPLFAPPKVVREPIKWTSGGSRVWFYYKRAKPAYVTWAECDAVWEESKRITERTGIQHSVDHIVPLVHPLVCGLHCPANFEIKPLIDNIRKSNNWWPDMPFYQLNLF